MLNKAVLLINLVVCYFLHHGAKLGRTKKNRLIFDPVVVALSSTSVGDRSIRVGRRDFTIRAQEFVTHTTTQERIPLKSIGSLLFAPWCKTRTTKRNRRLLSRPTLEGST